MATIKAYTDLSQSKTLSKILPLESADMRYHSVENEYGSGAFVAISKVITNGFENDDFYIDDIPCWSLAALLSVLPKVINNETLFIETSPALWHIGYRNIYTARTDNLVDACYNLILKLNKLKML